MGDWVVRPKRRLIERGDQSTQVKPKSMSVFECLAAAQGEPVSRNDLFDVVWPNAEVSDEVLTKCIVELRKAFGDSARDARVIETIPKLGFRLVLPVEPLEQAAPGGDHSAGDARPPRRGRRRTLRRVGLVLATLALAVAVSLSFQGTRAWLTEAGVTLLLKSAAWLSFYRLEQEPGIAVLPFVNFSGDPENEYFSDGMSVEITNLLARTSRLPVIARSSSFEFKDRPHDVREVGRQLGVTYVLEGSVRREHERIRLTVQLIDTTTGAALWSGIYKRQLGDVFDVQQEVATEIVDQINLALGEKIAPPPGGVTGSAFMQVHPPSSLEAYDLYLRGLEMLTSDRPALMEQAAGYFDRAIALESDYADAWAAKGYALVALGSADSGSSRIPASVYPEAIAAFKRALEIEPGHAFATGWLGVTLMLNDFKWAEGMRMLEQSLASNPNDARLQAVYGFYLDTMHLPGAEAAVERAYRLDPLGYEPIVDRAIHLDRQGRLLDAAALVETALIQDRGGYGANYFAAAFNRKLGRLDAAEEHIRTARRVANPVDLNLDALQWLIDAARGRAPLPPFSQVWKRMQTEKLSGAVLYDGWQDADTIAAVFDLAIRQRQPALRTALFGEKPPVMRDEDWRRFKEITGVTQFQQSLGH